MFPSFDNYIFDLDGTLLDTAPRILTCLKTAIKKQGLAIDERNLTSDIIGPPLQTIIDAIIPDVDKKTKENVITAFRVIYNDNPYQDALLYPEADKTITRLKKIGKHIFIATNKPLIPTQKLLSHFFSIKFDDISTSDINTAKQATKTDMLNHLLKKHNLNREKTLFIGDTKNDQKAANNCKISFAFATFGYEKNKSDLKKNSDFIINGLGEIL